MLLVRPSLVVAHWCRAFDTHVIDGIVHFLGRFTVWVSRWDGRFDGGIVDGLVNLTGNVIYAVGTWLRRRQTGYIRSYVLFLVLAALGLFVLLTYFIGMASRRLNAGLATRGLESTYELSETCRLKTTCS